MSQATVVASETRVYLRCSSLLETSEAKLKQAKLVKILAYDVAFPEYPRADACSAVFDRRRASCIDGQSNGRGEAGRI